MKLTKHERQLLEQLKANRRKFYREWFKRWGNRVYLYGVPKENLEIYRYRDKPDYGSEIRQIKEALEVIVKGEIIASAKFWEYLHTRYKQKFLNNYLFMRVKANPGCLPREDKNMVILELMARGFKHIDTVELDYTKAFIKCNIAPLVWPNQYNTQLDAIPIFEDIGIPGYTGIVIPKTK